MELFHRLEGKGERLLFSCESWHRFHLASFPPQMEDDRFADTMLGYWVNSAAHGDPNGVGLPEWPAYNLESRAFMELGDTIRPGTRLLEKESDFFERYYAAERAKP